MTTKVSKIARFALTCLSSPFLSISAKADTYAYDAQGRLTSVIYTAGGTVTYTYDAAGNRTAQVKAP